MPIKFLLLGGGGVTPNTIRAKILTLHNFIVSK